MLWLVEAGSLCLLKAAGKWGVGLMALEGEGGLWNEESPELVKGWLLGLFSREECWLIE